MKLPPALATRLGAIAESSLGVARAARASLVKALSALAGRLRGLPPRVKAIARLAAVGCLALAAAIALIGLAAGARARRDDAPPTAAEKPAEAPVRPAPSSPAIPGSGPGLASMLLIPGDGELSWPLALEPKARYTDADAAELSPDLGAVDIGDLSRRRKAALETIYGAVH
ncbi:MAG TPA: hypothetical protein P5298_03715 [Spirochaetia bacterium]|nr:hypothetical protein [Spirochaetaceae bacterium]HPE88657.1 hypothetical protein [Spirochaetales bacterium]HRW23495.1 hypothetical protein [Spirochaetia bacterium]